MSITCNMVVSIPLKISAAQFMRYLKRKICSFRALHTACLTQVLIEWQEILWIKVSLLLI